MRIKYIFALIGLLLGLGSISFPAAAEQDNSAWTHYTAFQSYPRRIMEGERYTYFLVYQQYYNSTKTVTEFGLPTGGILYFDKQNPEAGLRPLANRVNLSGSTIGMASYNPRNGMLVICYDGGSIDIVTDDGSVTTVNEIFNRFDAKSCAVQNISFDLQNGVWLGLKNGFLQLDATGAPVRMADFDISVDGICRVGDQVVASMNKMLYAAPLSSDINDVASFTKVTGTTNRSPLALMPLDDKTLAFVAVYGNNWNGIYTVTFDGNAWGSPILTVNSSKEDNTAGSGTKSQAFRQLANNTWFGNRLENNVLLTRDGYLVFNADFMYQIKRGLDSNGNVQFSKRQDNPKAVNKEVCGTYDFENFWVYPSFGRFARSTASDFGKSTSWGETTEYEAPAIHAIRRVLFAESPKYGLMMVQRGVTHDSGFSTVYGYAPLLTGFRNGKWNEYSPIYNKPAFASEETYKSKYKSTYPGKDPISIYADPAFPDYVWMGTFTDGFFAGKLSDPTASWLHWADPQNEHSSMPNFNPLFNNSTWKAVMPVTIAGFDADNTLWVYYNAMFDSKYGEICQLMGLTVEKRRAMLENHDIFLCGDWAVLPVNNTATGEDEAYALRHPKNKNKIIIGSGWEFNMVIYDHNGTLDDTSDDLQTGFSSLLNPDGGRHATDLVHQFAEDLVTGDVYLATDRGLHVMDVNEKLVQGAMPVRNLSVIGPNGQVQYVGQSSRCDAVCVDEYNRIWVGTVSDGVIGVSADRKSIFAHYRTANSELPSDKIMRLGWDSASKQLFISTALGIVSVRPDDPQTPDAALSLSAFPTEITADYAGTVAVSNVSGNAVLKVRDSNNRIVATLPVAEDNITHWNLLTNDGKNIPSGRYTIYDANGVLSPVEVTVIR